MPCSTEHIPPLHIIARDSVLSDVFHDLEQCAGVPPVRRAQPTSVELYLESVERDCAREIFGVIDGMMTPSPKLWRVYPVELPADDWELDLVLEEWSESLVLQASTTEGSDRLSLQLRVLHRRDDDLVLSRSGAQFERVMRSGSHLIHKVSQSFKDALLIPQAVRSAKTISTKHSDATTTPVTALPTTSPACRLDRELSNRGGVVSPLLSRDQAAKICQPATQPPGITQPIARPPGITQSPVQPPGITQSPVQPPGITQPPVQPPGITQPPVQPPGITQSPVQPPVQPPGITQPPVQLPGITQPPVQPPGITQSPVQPPGITQPPVQPPGITQPPVQPPGITQPPVQPPGITQPMPMIQPSGITQPPPPPPPPPPITQQPPPPTTTTTHPPPPPPPKKIIYILKLSYIGDLTCALKATKLLAWERSSSTRNSQIATGELVDPPPLTKRKSEKEEAAERVKQAVLLKKQQKADLLDALVPFGKVADVDWTAPRSRGRLNHSQHSALTSLSRNIELIQGPPATGKSTIIHARVSGCLPHKQAAIVMAVQNRAIEALAEKFAKTKTPFIVCGDRATGMAREYTGIAQLNKRPSSEMLLAKAAMDKTNPKEMATAREMLKRAVVQAATCLASNAQVLLCTSATAVGTLRCSGSRTKRKDKGKQQQSNVSLQEGFVDPDWMESDWLEPLTSRATTIVADEAGCISDRHVLPVLASCDAIARLVLVGDTKQLLVFSSLKAGHGHVGTSLMERLESHELQGTMLTEQYRMPPTLAQVVSLVFYDGCLVSALHKKALNAGAPLQVILAGDVGTTLTPLHHLCPETSAVESNVYDESSCLRFVGVDGSTEKEAGGTSSFNKAEAVAAMEAATGLAKSNPQHRVVVLCVYAAQVRLITHMNQNRRVEVLTVDASQGREWDHVILSLVCDNVCRLGFVSDARRMCVAMSRAMRTMTVVANPRIVACLPVIDDFCAAIRGESLQTRLQTIRKHELSQQFRSSHEKISQQGKSVHHRAMGSCQLTSPIRNQHHKRSRSPIRNQHHKRSRSPSRSQYHKRSRSPSRSQYHKRSRSPSRSQYNKRSRSPSRVQLTQSRKCYQTQLLSHSKIGAASRPTVFARIGQSRMAGVPNWPAGRIYNQHEVHKHEVHKPAKQLQDHQVSLFDTKTNKSRFPEEQQCCGGCGGNKAIKCVMYCCRACCQGPCPVKKHPKGPPNSSNVV